MEQSDETAFFVPRSPGQRAPPGSVQLKYVGGLDTSFAEEEAARCARSLHLFAPVQALAACVQCS